MDWQAALRARLVDAPDFAAMAGDRADWGLRAQGEPLPALVLTMIADGRAQHLKGFQAVQASRVQLDAYAATHKAAGALMDLAIDLLVPAETIGGHRFQRAMIEIEPRGLPARDGINTDEYRVSADLRFHHSNA